MLKEQKRLVLNKKDLARWVRVLQEKGEVFAPQRTASGEHVVQPLRDAGDFVVDYVNSIEPLKTFFFPQIESLFGYELQNGRYRLKHDWEPKARILLGVRSCDLSALKVLDQAMLSEPEDPYYRHQREQTTVVSFSCLRGGQNCFCVCTDSGPFLEEGYDIQLTDLGEQYLMEVATEKGEALLKGAEELFREATREEVRAREEAERKARDAFQEVHAYFAAAMRKLSRDEVAPEAWEEVGPLCIECGGCTYVCPVCNCFSVVDLPDESGGRRVRYWDHCLLAGYAREASGHNPREERGERLHHRMYHKMSRHYFLKLGGLGCVGCGRCVAACPTGAHMPALVEAVRKGAR